MQLTSTGKLHVHFRGFPAGDRRRLRCNLRCSYCNQQYVETIPFSREEFDRGRRLWDALEQVEDDIVTRINFDGETVFDPWARKIVGDISFRKNVVACEVITNNSMDPRKYLDQWDVPKMSFNCSFHPEQMTLTRFLANLDHLLAAGRPCFATVVAAPAVIPQLPSIAAALASRGVAFRPQLLLGGYSRRFPRFAKRVLTTLANRFRLGIYPERYTPEELGEIEKYFYSPEEFAYQLGQQTEGCLCYAGVDMITVFLDGTVTRCFGGELGSVTELTTGAVSLRNEAYPCPFPRCQCPAYMIFLKEFRKRYPLAQEYADHYERTDNRELQGHDL